MNIKFRVHWYSIVFLNAVRIPIGRILPSKILAKIVPSNILPRIPLQGPCQDPTLKP
jgi:hypothetical protein